MIPETQPAQPPQPAQVQFTRAERDYVYGVAMRYLNNPDDAHDVAQEAMLLAYRFRHQFQGKSRVTTWLYRIAASAALMHLRRRRRTPLMISLEATLEDGDPQEDLISGELPHPSTPEDVSATAEALGIAARRLSGMGEKYGTVFAMRFIEGFTEAEIAHRLGLKEDAVKSRAYRALSRIRNHLTEQFAEPPPAFVQSAA